MKEDSSKLHKILEENQTESGFFRSYYSQRPNEDLEITTEHNIESPFIHALILEELAKLNNPLIRQRIELGRKALLNSSDRHNGFYVWRFVKPFNNFQYSPDFDDTAVAIRSLVVTGESGSTDLSESYQKLIQESHLWVSEKDAILTTFLNRDERNSIDFVVNAHALHTFLLTRPQEKEIEKRLVNTLVRFINSDLFDRPLEVVSKYYFYDSSFTYAVSNIQEVGHYFDEKTIERIRKKSQTSKPINILDASFISLSSKGLNGENEVANDYLETHIEDSDKTYAFFRRRRGNLYFGSPLLTYMFSHRATKSE